MHSSNAFTHSFIHVYFVKRKLVIFGGFPLLQYNSGVQTGSEVGERGAGLRKIIYKVY